MAAKKDPKETASSTRRISRRALLLGTAQLGIMGGLAWRMHYLGVDQSDQYRMLAEENRINVRLIPPERGEIFDRNGVAIARNQPSYRITIVREDAGDVDKVLDKLKELMPLDPDDIARAKKEMRRSAPFLPVTVADRVDWQDVSRVAVNSPSLPGITPEVGLSRGYPLAQDFAHLVGYVGPVSDYDLSKIADPDPVLRIPGFQIGKVGIEAKMEDDLRGSAGSRRVEVNAVGRVMRELSRDPGTPGENIQLTIDAKLQNYVQLRLSEEKAASAVVIDCATGDLLAMASNPSFDPNLFVRGISVKNYHALTSDVYRPLSDKAVQGTYPPGSTFKMTVAMAGLESGTITPDTTYYCPGFIEVGGRRFHCWNHYGHGNLNVVGGLEHSCDVFFYKLAMDMGIDKISAMARRMGLGHAPDLPLSAIAEGLAPDKQWKRESRNQAWQIGDTVNAAIGQGYVLASPLQLATMVSRVATGHHIEPRIIKSIDGVEQPLGRGDHLGISDMALSHARQGMYEVSNNRRGTGYRARIIDETMRMAGKSGTSQVFSITAAERAAGLTHQKDLPWHRRDHALWVDFAPFDNPKVAVCVVVEHGISGSGVAAPIARDITLQALCDGDPPIEAYPAADRHDVEERRARINSMRRHFAPAKKVRA